MTKNADITTKPVTKKVTELKLQEPIFYQVILLNDDYTPMDFVIKILIELFHKNQEEAIVITHAIHNNNACPVAIYPKEIAEEKACQTKTSARKNGFPLNCIIEPVR